ncbi:SDR family NAD(P)-dependent oxidoreductase [Vibrio sp. SCSIO 43140]|uniref:SDR family NAD(P)-dependent oxidoreductase n=1 Tax=Vibrio sp. SCSIO 43140 TaxID=2819100 RepID=UPI00207551D4|nr:SDR family NAD(P)-dependent oxidoreductase [Vibrio sp. SCSIO 43140]USD63675.1 SDR family NAD(P)-dependent oxidoreductase [Vibrio sp. SCSIO 43140]
MNKNVLVTGGAMGMGKAYVIRAIKDGAKNIVIWDMNEEAMQATKEELSNGKTEIHTFKVDVTDTELVYRTAEQVLNSVGAIDLLINNAGIVVSEHFIEHDPKKIDLSMQINSIAPMHVVRAFLPAMADRSDCHIVNIASGAGLMYCPRIIVYCASKWAMLGWSQGLRVELKETLPHIKVTTVTPGHIDTGMFEGAHSKFLPLISIDTMVDAVWNGMKKDKAMVARPRAVGLLPFVRGILGLKGFDWLLKVSGTNDFMAGHEDNRKK